MPEPFGPATTTNRGRSAFMPGLGPLHGGENATAPLRGETRLRFLLPAQILHTESLDDGLPLRLRLWIA